jgi:hypothetical protein
MKELALDIKETNNTSQLLNISGFGLLMIGFSLFVVIDKSLPYWGIVVSLPIAASFLFFLINYLFFISKKSGEMLLRKEGVIFIKNGKRRNFLFTEVSKIRLILFNKAYTFHRNWWPLKEESIPYEANELNYIHIKPKKGKSRLIRFRLDSKKKENELLDFFREKCGQYHVALKII